jgi:hypothetical protein
MSDCAIPLSPKCRLGRSNNREQQGRRWALPVQKMTIGCVLMGRRRCPPQAVPLTDSFAARRPESGVADSARESQPVW